MEPTLTDGVAFFVPCLNEEGNVGRVIDTLSEVMKGIGGRYEILIVDDASTDHTLQDVEEARQRHPDAVIKVIRNVFCRGLGRNYFIAAHRAEADHFMLVNGDAAEPPETIQAILALKGQADAIVPLFRSS